MKRAPIVIGATVFGTAAVLGFHAHAPALPSSGAAASSAPTSTPAPTSAATPASPGTKSALGDPISTQYGNAQVRVTVANGKITTIEAVQLQSADPKSVQISGYAAPILQQSALSKQTANVDSVSGATYTSESYKASLQSALDKAGYKAVDGSRASTDTSDLGA
jgi:uncharacterized protein with FMN-binding domain